MGEFTSFGYWVRRRRKMLDMTQAELAGSVNCSLSMVRKIERDERRPSQQLAELLAEGLAIEEAQRQPFLSLARGTFVQDMPAPDNAGPGLPPQDPFEPSPSGPEQAPFVARENELRGLHQHLKEVVAGKGRLVFLAGEAGSGKTTVLQEFAREAQAAWDTLLVAGGSCDIYAGLGDPLLPFREILRLLVGDVAHLSVASVLDGEHAARLRRALPTIAQALLDHGPHLIETLVSRTVLEARINHDFPEPANAPALLGRLQELRTRRLLSGELELQQDRLFEEVSTTLKALARRYPLLLTLDDLHWADLSSVSLLAHLTFRLQNSPILIIGTFRPEDLAQGRRTGGMVESTRHPLRDVINESQRRFGQNRIDLDRGGSGAGRGFVDAYLDVEPNRLGAGFRQRLAELTEGHPLFVVELLRDMKEQGHIEEDDDGRWVQSAEMSWRHIPARVEGVVEKRITRLPEDLRQILTVGSIQGDTFEAEVSAQVLHMDARELIVRLSGDLDRRHRLVREQGVRHVGPRRLSHYRFRHHLFQKYLYGRLGEAERIYLHEAVGNALEALHVGQEEEEMPAAQLARHFREARRNEKASRYLLLAGQNAARVLAFEEAATHFEQGLALLEEVGRSAELDRLEFELRLAQARAYWHGGRVEESLTGFLRSIEMARTFSEPDALARAALAYEEPRWRLNLDAELTQRFMGEALAAMEDEESALRVRLLVSLSRSLLEFGEREGLRARVDEALRIARRINDPVALYEALRISALIDRRPQTTEARLASVEEMISIARSLGDREREADALALFIFDQLELGRMDLVDEAMATHRRVANELGQPFLLHVATVLQTMRAIMRGAFKEAERLAREAADLSQQMGIAAVDGIYGMHMFTIRREQGRLAEVAPIVKLFVESKQASAAWRPGLALIYASLGLEKECRAVFEELVSDGFAGLPQDSLRVASLAYLAEVCAFLQDGERARTLYEALLPYDGRAIVVGAAMACQGAAARFLGMLATSLAEWATAERHFRGALELDARMGARPWLAHSQYEYAAMLLARGQGGDRRRASALLEEAVATAEELGMGQLLQNGSDLQSRL